MTYSPNKHCPYTPPGVVTNIKKNLNLLKLLLLLMLLLRNVLTTVLCRFGS